MLLYVLLLPSSLSSLFLSLCSPVQLLSEKISGAEGTKLDEDFMEMERVSSVLVSVCYMRLPP